jgi:hypothetical protein
MDETQPLRDCLSVAVAHLLFAKRFVDAAGERIADPDDAAEQKDAKGKQKSVGHESVLS